MERCAQNYGTCRGCKRQILWTRTKAGKAMPCDPEVILFNAGGEEVFVLPDGRVSRGTRSDDGALKGYISHFSTCPNSNDFRKRSK